jgi:hypothetical protein
MITKNQKRITIRGFSCLIIIGINIFVRIKVPNVFVAKFFSIVPSTTSLLFTIQPALLTSIFNGLDDETNSFANLTTCLGSDKSTINK